MKYLWFAFLGLFSLGILGVIGGMAVVMAVVGYYGNDLPDYTVLKNYDPPIVTRLYAGDGRLMAEYAQEKRVFVPIGDIPDLVKHAFISAEDENFYKHQGVDFSAILRAGINNLMHHGKRAQGASTISQQVAKNFFLGSERSLSRKIREAILAYRMEQAMSKDHLLELYLNQIYLGARSYGVAAAALQYFNKSLDELTVAEAAYLAELPKGPADYDPVRHPDKALDRRTYVISRMLAGGYITQAQADEANAQPLGIARRDDSQSVNAPFFAEEVRRELAARYGADSLYKGGLVVRTTLDPRLQDIALRSLRYGLQQYDQRHGYRGAFKRYDTMGDWKAQLQEIQVKYKPVDMPESWRLAAVIAVNAEAADIGFADGTTSLLKLPGVKWAKQYLDDGYHQGPDITAVTDVVKQGDVIMVEQVQDEPPKPPLAKPGDKDKPAPPPVKPAMSWALRQIPLLQGAVVAMDPHTGRILAMQGGWKYEYGASEYNRVTQAHRQPGSSFKPFVYTAALEHGFTPSSLIMDGPFTIEDRPGHLWSPVNYHGGMLGPTTIRVALEKSRNLVTVRLANHLGMEMIADYAEKFGVVDQLPLYLSSALGAVETTPLRLTSAYATFVNGGKKITPTVIDRIQDRRGKTIFRHDDRPCDACGNLIKWESQDVPEAPDARPQIIDPRVAYQMVHILEGVTQRGTAAALKDMGYPLAGKTGTTNKSRDTWFIGFSPDLLVGVFMGFDNPRSLGKRETGASVAVPVFKKFMTDALKDELPTPFRIPPGIKNIQIDAATGKPAEPGDKNVIWEAYVAGTGPSDNEQVLNDSAGPDQQAAASSNAGEDQTGADEDAAADTDSDAGAMGPPDVAPAPDAPPYAPAQGNSPEMPATRPPENPIRSSAPPSHPDSPGSNSSGPNSSGEEATGTGGFY